MNDISPQEIDLLLLFYTFSDENGKVNMLEAAHWAKNKFGIILPAKPFTLTQEHINCLMEHSELPDIRSIISKAKAV
jgi:hypothetical protein